MERSAKTRLAINLALVMGVSSLSFGIAHAQVGTTSPVEVVSPETGLDVTTSGVPVINIAAPRADGTSYNVYSRLDAGREGVIFNNSAEIGSSGIGGTVLANPNVQAGGTARLILNEVTSGIRSDLQGPLEVFGTRAGLIIANPAGITCNGCGFINISRATLSTGQPTFDGNGSFAGLQVNGGSVNIEGSGLFAGDVDYFDIVSQSALINANLVARDLYVAGGNADFGYADRTHSDRGGAAGIVIDSSALGGMYANRIRLIGTGAGVGVNLRGIVSADQGSIAVVSDGAISVRDIVAERDVVIASRDASVDIAGGVAARGSAFVRAGGTIAITDNQAEVDEAIAIYNQEYAVWLANRPQNPYGPPYYLEPIVVDQDWYPPPPVYNPVALVTGTIEAGYTVGLTAGGDIVHDRRGSLMGSTILANAGNDIVIGGGSKVFGGDIVLDARRDLNFIARTQPVTSYTYTNLGGGNYNNRISSSLAVTGAEVDAIGDFVASAGRDLSIEAAIVNVEGIGSLEAGRDVVVTGIASTSTTTETWKTSKRVSGSSAESISIFDGSSISANGALFINAAEELEVNGSSLASNEDIRFGAAAGTIAVSGSDVSAIGDVLMTGQNVLVQGSLNSSSYDETIRTVKRGFLSKRTTTATASNDIETIFASTIIGDSVTLASHGDVNVLDSNIASELSTDILAGGSVIIGSLPASSNFYNSLRIKKSGLSIGGDGFFLGVSKSSQITTLDIVSNAGSIIGSARGDVSLSAGVLGLRTGATTPSGALAIKGSEITAPGLISLSGDDIYIQNNFDTASSTSVFRQSSFGLSLSFYENVSAAANSFAGLPGRIDAASSGSAGTAITAASETLRSVAAVTNALTNTAGVTLSVGYSSVKRTNSAQEIGVVDSNIAGGSIDIRANNVNVAGSTVTALNDLTIVAQQDANFTSAQNQLATQDSASGTSFGFGGTLGVGVVGGVNASLFVNFGMNASSGYASQTSQFNSQIVAGGLLSLTAGRDASLRGAVVQGLDLNASVGRTLLIESLQDSSNRYSTGYGFNLGLSYGSGVGWGFSAGVNYDYALGSSGRVFEQSALTAKNGALVANVAGDIRLIGGVIAAIDANRADTGRLIVRTGSLSVSDIGDAANSIDYGFGASIDFNNVFDDGASGANWPVIDAYYASTTFAQNTRATVGAGELTVYNGAPDVNRDVTRSQVVTKDSAVGFGIYADVAAATEVYNLVADIANGRRNGLYRSTIMTGVNALRTRPLGLVQDAIGEVQAWGATVGEAGSRNDSAVERLLNQLGAQFEDRYVAEARETRLIIEDAIAINIARGMDPAEARQIGESAEFRIVAEDVAASNIANYRRNERPVSFAQLDQATAAPVPAPPPPPSDTAPQTGTETVVADIIVTGQRRGNGDYRPSLAHRAVGSIGEFYNNGSSLRRTFIDTSIGVLSSGGVGYIVGEAQGAVQEQLLPASALQFIADQFTRVNVGIDSLFQSRGFNSVGSENAAQDNTFQSHNATTGTGLVVAAIPGVSAVMRRGGGSLARAPRRAERQRGTCSFAGDTLVRTMLGLTPIKEVKAGTDKVWARDQRTGKMGYRLVEAQYSNPYEVTVRITIRDVESSNEQTLVSNAIHPIFVQLPEDAVGPPSSEGHVYKGSIARGAWIDAANLKPGYRLLNDDGSWAVVAAVSSTPELLTAYNLKVNGYHTYFVTGDVKAEPIWVHNNCAVPQYPTAYPADNLYFGTNPNANYHVERHLVASGIDVPTTFEAIRAHIVAQPALAPGQGRRVVMTVNGRQIEYRVQRLGDGRINVGTVIVR